MFYANNNRIRVGPKNGVPLLDTEIAMPHLMGSVTHNLTMTSGANSQQMFGMVANLNAGYQAINGEYVPIMGRPDFLITRARFNSITGGTRTIKGVSISSSIFVPVGSSAPYVWFQGSQMLTASINENGVAERKVLHVFIKNGIVNCQIESYRISSNYSDPADPETFSFELRIWYGKFGRT